MARDGQGEGRGARHQPRRTATRGRLPEAAQACRGKVLRPIDGQEMVRQRAASEMARWQEPRRVLDRPST